MEPIATGHTSPRAVNVQYAARNKVKLPLLLPLDHATLNVDVEG
jgi:hypothetical protein